MHWEYNGLFFDTTIRFISGMNTSSQTFCELVNLLEAVLKQHFNLPSAVFGDGL